MKDTGCRVTAILCADVTIVNDRRRADDARPRSIAGLGAVARVAICTRRSNRTLMGYLSRQVIAAIERTRIAVIHHKWQVQRQAVQPTTVGCAGVVVIGIQATANAGTRTVADLTRHARPSRATGPRIECGMNNSAGGTLEAPVARARISVIHLL
jgi:hypothetical protein